MATKKEIRKIVEDPNYQMTVAEDWEEVADVIEEPQD
jgi:hypothetical protein